MGLVKAWSQPPSNSHVSWNPSRGQVVLHHLGLNQSVECTDRAIGAQLPGRCNKLMTDSKCLAHSNQQIDIILFGLGQVVITCESFQQAHYIERMVLQIVGSSSRFGHMLLYFWWKVSTDSKYDKSDSRPLPPPPCLRIIKKQWCPVSSSLRPPLSETGAFCILGRMIKWKRHGRSVGFQVHIGYLLFD